MKYLNLELIKSHLNLDADFTADDTYLVMLGGVVEEAVKMHIDDDLDKLANDNNGVCPLPLQQAMLLLLGTYYDNRENIAYSTNQEVGNTYTYLLDLYKNYSGAYTTNAMSELQYIKNRIEELQRKKIVGGNNINVTTSGDITTVNLTDELNEGDY